jgi:hypothetical protein
LRCDDIGKDAFAVDDDCGRSFVAGRFNTEDVHEAITLCAR